MNRDRNQSRVFFDAFNIIVGALALLNNLHILDTSDFLPFWPLVFVGFGAMKLYHARHSGAYILGGLLVALGVGMTLQHLGIMHFRWREWWPAFLIFAGAMVLSR